jgi:hypothetical protein
MIKKPPRPKPHQLSTENNLFVCFGLAAAQTHCRIKINNYLLLYLSCIDFRKKNLGRSLYWWRERLGGFLRVKCLYACVCVCEKERERDRDGGKKNGQKYRKRDELSFAMWSSRGWGGTVATSRPVSPTHPSPCRPNPKQAIRHKRKRETQSDMKERTDREKEIQLDLKDRTERETDKRAA